MDLPNAGVRFETDADLPNKEVRQSRVRGPGWTPASGVEPAKPRQTVEAPDGNAWADFGSVPPRPKASDELPGDVADPGAEGASYFSALLACIVGASCAVGFASSYIDNVFAVKADEGPIPIPKTYREAIASKHAAEWKEAMRDEVQGKMSFNRAWDLVDRRKVPRNRRVLRGKWVFSVKYDSDGTVKRFKARWVGCGFAQREGIDYDLTYASTLRATSFRILIAIAAQYGLDLFHIDVTKAFTQAELDDVELFVEQPDGFAEPGMVCRMLMALEGLKQSAHLWQNACAEFLVQIGFYRLEHEPCLFRLCVGKAGPSVATFKGAGNSVKDGMSIILGVFVDDLICAFPPGSAPLFEWFERVFSKRFRCTPSAELTKYMGIEVKRDRKAGTISLSQRDYISSMMEKYMIGVHTKLWSGPVGSSQGELDAFMTLKPAADEAERERVGHKNYMSIVGSLLYAACMTRPDIAFHCAVLGQHMQNPSMACLDAARGVLAYLGRTMSHCLTYGPVRHGYASQYFEGWRPSLHDLYCWFDSSWGRAPTAMCGHVVMRSGAAISWSARKLKLIPLSSCEAEYACGSNACRDLRYIQLVLNELSQPGIDTVVAPETRVITDSQSARDVVENPGVTARTRHFERWMHFMRRLATYRHIRMQLVKTHSMLADVFTKAVGRAAVASATRVLLNL